MARTCTSSMFDKIRGRVGDVIVKTYKYGEVISRRPRMGIIPPSEKQRAQHDKWRAAAEYYRRVKTDPALSACYAAAVKKTGYPLSAITNRDFHRPPRVLSIELGHYHGKPGDRIEVVAIDDFFVAAVTVTLRDAKGTLLESGPATPDVFFPWHYLTRTDARLHAPITIEAMAQDLPGNRATLSITWSHSATQSAPQPPSQPAVAPAEPPPTFGLDL